MTKAERSFNARKGWMVWQLRLMSEHWAKITDTKSEDAKSCCTCNQRKPLEQFFKNKARPSGLDPQCRSCHKMRYRARYANNKGSERYKASKRLTAARYRARHREISKAHSLAAAKKKFLKKIQCERCGAGGILHMHHPDYRKPLEVITLCVPCHERAHHGEIK